MDAFTLEKIDFDAVRQILAGYAAGPLGRQAARKISCSTRPEIVRQWLATTSEMVAVIRDIGVPPLGSVADIVDALRRAKPAGSASGEDFADIAATLDALGEARRFFLKLDDDDHARLKQLAEPLADFSDEVAAIRTVVTGDGSIRPDASPKLRELRRDIDNVGREVHQVIHRYLRNPEVKKLLTQANVTMHGDRYVLPVRWDHRGRLPGVVHRESNTGATVFVEPNACVELNNRLVDLHDHERMEIDRLLTDLAVKIHRRHGDINAALHAAGLLDLANAKAQYAYQTDSTCPTISDIQELEVFQARHPLLEAAASQRKRIGHADVVEDVVPIDIRLGKDFDILVITGSNTGGKTVTLKTLALLVAMTQAGLHIPVRRGAVLPVFDDVLIDIGDEQSLEQSLSTFGAHIERLKYILGRAGKRTLVLLDELGSGTDPDEGGAIGQAVLDELRRLNCRAMVTTHISILKAYALNHDRVDNASVEFDTQTLRPTYHLRIGTPGESHAITVADKLGLPGRLVDAARKHLGKRGSQFRKAMRLTGRARKKAEQARAEAAAAEVQAARQAEQLQETQADIEQLKQDFADWLARLSEMKPGEEIFVPQTNATGTLERLELHKQVAVVNVDALQFEVPLSELMPDLGQRAARKKLSEQRDTLAAELQAAREARQAAEEAQAQAEKVKDSQQAQARQFDRWVSLVGRAKAGETVPIARKPGRGTLKEINFQTLRASVTVDGEDVELPLGDLYPQTGPYGPGGQKSKEPKPSNRHEAGRENKDRPLPRRQAGTAKAERAKQKMLAAEPGQDVYVVPFRQRARLVRINEDKDTATVSAGAFEMEVALADLEPLNA